MFREVANKVKGLIMLDKCSYNERINKLSNKRIELFKTWRRLTSVRKYRGAMYIEGHKKTFVKSIHLLLNVFSVPTVAVNVRTDGVLRVFQN
jgi:hypothetical protein